MNRQIVLIFDIVSPNAYLAWWPLKEVARRQDAAILVSPVFLGGMHKLTGNAPPMIRDADVKGKSAYAMLEMRRFIERHGLGKFRLNPKFPFNSITIQRMLTACEPADRPAFVDALLPPVWERGIDVADDGALRAALGQGRVRCRRAVRARGRPRGQTATDGRHDARGRSRSVRRSDFLR